MYTSTSRCYFLSLTCTFSPRFTPFQPSCLPSLAHPLPCLPCRGQRSSSLWELLVPVLCSFTLYLDSIRSEQTSYKLQVPLLDFMCIYVHMCGWVLVYIYRERPESTLVSISHQHSLPPVPFWRQGLSLTKLSLRRPSKPSSPACLCLPSTETTVHDNTPGYFLWALDIELGPCGCMANVLSTELSPQPYLLALGASQKL